MSIDKTQREMGQVFPLPDTLLQLANHQPPSLRASILIVSYNSRFDLAQCIPSVLEHSPQDTEVLIVDNASQDGTPEWLDANFPQIRLVRNVDNLGFGAANNLAARLARGRYLSFLNPDTVVQPGWLEALIAALEADPHAGLATSKILLLQDPKVINTCGNQIHLTGLTLCRGMGQPATEFNHLDTVDAVSGCAFVIRRDLFKTLGGFDPLFFLYMEDTDLSLRARLAGYRCIYTPDSVVYHNYTLHFGSRKTFFQERNRKLMLLKCLHWRTLLTLLPVWMLGELVTWGFVLIQDRAHLGNKLAAYAWVLFHWGEVLEAHRHTQTLRGISDRDLLATAHYRLDFEQTGTGPTAKLAHWIFDPLFYSLKHILLALISSN